MVKLSNKTLIIAGFTTSYHHQQTDHAYKMARACERLGSSVRRTDAILAHMREQRAVSSEEYELARGQTTTYDLVRVLICIMRKGQVKAYDCFLEALKLTGQEHLYHLLEETGE